MVYAPTRRCNHSNETLPFHYWSLLLKFGLIGDLGIEFGDETPKCGTISMKTFA